MQRRRRHRPGPLSLREQGRPSPPPAADESHRSQSRRVQAPQVCGGSKRGCLLRHCARCAAGQNRDYSSCLCLSDAQRECCRMRLTFTSRRHTGHSGSCFRQPSRVQRRLTVVEARRWEEGALRPERRLRQIRPRPPVSRAAGGPRRRRQQPHPARRRPTERLTPSKSGPLTLEKCGARPQQQRGSGGLFLALNHGCHQCPAPAASPRVRSEESAPGGRMCRRSAHPYTVHPRRGTRPPPEDDSSVPASAGGAATHIAAAAISSRPPPRFGGAGEEAAAAFEGHVAVSVDGGRGSSVEVELVAVAAASTGGGGVLLLEEERETLRTSPPRPAEDEEDALGRRSSPLPLRGGPPVPARAAASLLAAAGAGAATAAGSSSSSSAAPGAAAGGAGARGGGGTAAALLEEAEDADALYERLSREAERRKAEEEGEESPGHGLIGWARARRPRGGVRG